MQQSPFKTKYKCPVCNTDISVIEGYSDYFNCPECNTALNTAKSYIYGYKTTDKPLKYIQFVKFLLDINYITENDLIDVTTVMSKRYNKYLEEFYNQALFDIVIFSKSGKKILCNEKISYSQAKEICSREDTRFVNSFAGFCIHGTYDGIEKGRDFKI